jgi:UDP-N-acetylglucosamine 2-epimerase
MSDKIKVMTIIGTRPEIIRLSRVMSLLDKSVEHVIVHTGQNYDYELNEIFFKELEVRKPDYFLNVDTTTLGTVYGWTLIKAEEVLGKERPDAVLVLGDTNSAIACIMAKRMKVPVYHMEAGNRCFDLNVPEEINRRIIDHISDFNLVYTEHARRNLLAEGLPARRVYLTGSPMPEVLNYHMDCIRKCDVMKKLQLEKGKYLLVSTHREENVDNSENLSMLLRTMEKASERFGFPVIVSTHPRTKNRLERLGKKLPEKIRFLKPFGFFDYVHLQMNALCVLSDSGTISEEASILGFPAVTIRNAMERPEAMDCGTIVLTGLEPETILAAIQVQISDDDRNAKHRIPSEYEIQDVSLRVVKLIIGTAKLSNYWAGIRLNDLT